MEDQKDPNRYEPEDDIELLDICEETDTVIKKGASEGTVGMENIVLEGGVTPGESDVTEAGDYGTDIDMEDLPTGSRGIPGVTAPGDIDHIQRSRRSDDEKPNLEALRCELDVGEEGPDDTE